jgi:hypothetical protein
MIKPGQVYNKSWHIGQALNDRTSVGVAQRIHKFPNRLSIDRISGKIFVCNEGQSAPHYCWTVSRYYIKRYYTEMKP